MELDAGIALQIGGIVDEKLGPLHKSMPAPAPKPIRRRFGGSGTATAGQILNVATYPQPAAGKMWVIRKLGLYGSDGHTAVSVPGTAPAVNQIPLGATGVATYNNNSFGVNQTITGGTVTAIAINGTTTGLTSGVFFVPAGGTVTVTYSVAPTTFSTAFAGTVAPVLATADIFAGSTQDENNVDFTGIIASAVTIPFKLNDTAPNYGNRHLTCYGMDQVYALVTGAPTGQSIVLVGEADEYMLNDMEATHT